VYPTTRGWRNRVDIPQPQAQTARVLGELCDVIASGAFIHAPEESGCRWCKFGGACGRQPVERASAKLHAPANSILEPYRRLRSHA
jgi:hypothetical protein